MSQEDNIKQAVEAIKDLESSSTIHDVVHNIGELIENVGEALDDIGDVFPPVEPVGQFLDSLGETIQVIADNMIEKDEVDVDAETE